MIAPARVAQDGAAHDVRRRPLSIAASWLGRVGYRDAWDLQRRLAAARAEDRIPDQLLLLEHPAVLTLGRHADESHVLATPAELERRGIDVVRVERGGEVTYHGPGQLVAYPILSLTARGLLIRPFVRALEAAMRDTCAAFGVEADRRDGHPGCWCDGETASPRKIGALGIRVERGVTFHGIALNVATDLADFELIDPCGMPGIASTSLVAEGSRSADLPATEAVLAAATVFAAKLAAQLGAPAAMPRGVPPDDPAAARRELERLAAMAG
ncbi:MAG TPA: lipoyl(octanoyl) transferase LipB [Candidatus Limnocylindrales bacterium]